MIIAHAVIEHWQLKPGVLVLVLSNYTLGFYNIILQLYYQGCKISYIDKVSQDQFS